jgi:hypothetical protein
MPIHLPNLSQSSARWLGLIVAAVVAAAPHSLHAQQPADSVQPSPAGTWRGTSICTPGHPACHDETVVYRIRASGARFEIAASKIVQGEEEPMFTHPCDYSAETHVLRCPASYGTWSFTVTDRTMTGTLVSPANVLYRRISATRANG